MASFMTFVTVVFFILLVPFLAFFSYPVILLWFWIGSTFKAPFRYDEVNTTYNKIKSICNQQDEYLRIHSEDTVGITGKTVGEIQEMLTEYIYKEEHRECKHYGECYSAAEWQEYLQKKIDKSLSIILPRKYEHFYAGISWGDLFPPFEFKKDLEIDLLRSKLECRKNAYLNLLTDLLWEYSYANGWQEVLDRPRAKDGSTWATCISIKVNNDNMFEYKIDNAHPNLNNFTSLDKSESIVYIYDKSFGWNLRVYFRGYRDFIKIPEDRNDVKEVTVAMNEIVKPFCETFMQYFVDLSQIKDDNNHRIISL